ncbi:polyprenyl synthetase family protein [Streptococcus pluranimalium]|uniref:polyprenyl synthetase family protein n=1 Tax=Streptococcus hyovaginalis TaxID=149015 RepID=UPI0014797D87
MVHYIWDDYPDVQKGLKAVKDIMVSEISVIHPDFKAKIMAYINAPGKYLRSGLCLLLSQLRHNDIPEGKLYLGAYLEILHLATLIHDDVIDQADHRRGIEVIHQTYSNRIAIYAGDYLLSYANRLLWKAANKLDFDKDDQELLHSKLIERILAGELAQLMNQFDQHMTMKTYLKQIKGKTALLFALACQMGAWEKGVSKRESHTAFLLGQNIGMAFQMTDDLIDYQLLEESSGKPWMQDIQNGIYTAPYLLAKQKQADLDKVFAISPNKQWTAQELMAFYNHLVSLGAFQETEKLVAAYFGKMSQQSQKLLSDEQSDQMVHFLETIMKRQF